MADIDVRIRQRSAIEFMTAEGEMPIRIHETLKNVYGDATLMTAVLKPCLRFRLYNLDRQKCVHKATDF